MNNQPRPTASTVARDKILADGGWCPDDGHLYIWRIGPTRNARLPLPMRVWEVIALDVWVGAHLVVGVVIGTLWSVIIFVVAGYTIPLLTISTLVSLYRPTSPSDPRARNGADMPDRTARRREDEHPDG